MADNKSISEQWNKGDVFEVSHFRAHILLGKTAPEKIKNAARNIEEKRTHPIQVVCRKPA